MSTSTASPTVLVIGGTGTISWSVVNEAVSEGMTVSVLNRGRSLQNRPLPAGVELLTADIHDTVAVTEVLDGRMFDTVVNFLSFAANDAAEAVELFRGRVGQYVHISTASMYRKPILQVPIVESNLLSNPFVSYARDKIAAEEVLWRAHAADGFPVTIVRPSHTYDDITPPLPGGWTVFDRIDRGDEIVVHGDGTSLWTLTHAADLAVGLVGLLGNHRAIGEAFHITSDDIYTWDQIYSLVAGALGRQARLAHVPSEFFPLAAPDWFWSELVVGDLSHSAVFDNSKIRRYVPGFAPRRTFIRSVLELAKWRADHPEQARGDAETNAVMNRLATGHANARAMFASLAPGSDGPGQTA